MNIISKMDDELYIKFDGTEGELLASDERGRNLSLRPGVMVGGEHYGFVIIYDNDGKRKEISYPTQCRINSVSIEDKILKITEEGKKGSWEYDRDGELIYSLTDKFTEDYARKLMDDYEHSDTPTCESSIRIKLTEDKNERLCYKNADDNDGINLYPGVFLGSLHFGFTLIIDKYGYHKEITYPTENRIDAVGAGKDANSDIRIYEIGKYHPWIFSSYGELKEESGYNIHLPKDVEFIKRHSINIKN